MNRIWIYQSDRKLSDGEVKVLEERLQSFTEGWQTHGKQLDAGFEIAYNHFIILKVNEEMVGASGCSIDSSVRLMKEIEQELGISLFDRQKVAYLANGEVEVTNYHNLANLFKAGMINENTIIFNNLVPDEAAMLSGWQIPLSQSLYMNFVS